MLKLVLIRHGHTIWNAIGKFQGQSDVALTNEGLDQAYKLARNFPFKHIDRLISSDLQRAADTAQYLSDMFGVRVERDAAFREINFGEWEGMTFEEIEERWPSEMVNFWRHPSKLQIPGGETFAQVQARIIKRLGEIIDEYEQPHEVVRGENIWGKRDPEANSEGTVLVIVAHGVVVRSIIAHYLGITLDYIWRIRQDNTALNILRIDGQMVNLELLNSTEHLRAKPKPTYLQYL